MALKDLLVCIDPTTAGDARLKLAFNLARANNAHLASAYPLPEAPIAHGGPTGFGGVPGMTGIAEEPVSPAARSPKSSMKPNSPTASSIASKKSCGVPASTESGTSCPTATRRR
jgi:hypothetical protein